MCGAQRPAGRRMVSGGDNGGLVGGLLQTETGRVEAFSDGVLAIAITLLVLDLRPPAHEPGRLVVGLLGQWPAYLGYVTSFRPSAVVTHHGRLDDAPQLYRAFDQRTDGVIKTVLRPSRPHG